MATLLLTAAGSAIGSAALPAGLGFLGTTISGAAIGNAVGGVLGQALDQRLFGSGAQVREGPRLKTLDIQTSTEGEPIPRVFGRMRLAGQIIWSTRFKETPTTQRQGGGKGIGGGPSIETTTYSYSVSCAVGLCEGPITGIGRIWADGKPMPLEDVTWRLHKGMEDQARDPLIAALTPDTPAFRGTAYLVFEDLPLERYGNRLPQITVEVRRAANPTIEHRDGPSVSDLLTGVALSPGSGEFALATQPVRRVLGEGVSASENINNTRGIPDFAASMDQLADSAPNVDSALLVVSWFGTDLRAGQCRIRPAVDRQNKETEPLTWKVAGETRGTSALVSETNGSSTYGGTPADIAVFQAIQELRARGKKTVFYPFILMDIPPDNPMGQPAHPWRGRIFAQTSEEVEKLFGLAQPADFGAWDGGTLSGPAEPTLRRMVLHYAHLCAAAGGVDAFVIGSELRDLTQSISPDYPAVTELRRLAADVRMILPNAKITYAADWSEYNSHRPDGEVYFHLDPLWADPNIDMVAIDNYLPLSDWRAGKEHLDAQSYPSIYDPEYLATNVENGEHADWYYGSEADRAAQNRTPIIDTAHDEDWVFGVKKIRDWWRNPHHNRPGGARDASSTAWQPSSKPIWFTEAGCPAVDHGTNQPNVFVDPKSSENALPHFSRGIRDDAIQRRYLQTMLSYWRDDPMVESIHIWTWDTRPYPDFPLRSSVWSDGENYRLGHWIAGRLDAAPLAEIVAELCEMAGESRIDVSRLTPLVDGYSIDRPLSARDALAPLMLTYGFDAVESDGLLRFVPRGDSPLLTLSEDDLVETEGGVDPFQLTRAQETDLPRAVRLGFIRSDAEYRRGMAEATRDDTASRRVEASSQAIALTSRTADAAARRWLAESHVAKDHATLTLPPSRLALDATDVIALSVDGRALPHRIDRITDGEMRDIEATRTAPDLYVQADGPNNAPEPTPLSFPAPPQTVFLDLPLLRGDEKPGAPYVAAFSDPWTPTAVYSSVGGDDYRHVLTLDAPATMGRTLADLPVSAPARWLRTSVDVKLFGGALLSRPRLATLAGANIAAFETAQGWEVIQFQTANLVAPQTYRLSGLLRGQAGTEPLISMLPSGTRFVLIDEALKQLPFTGAEVGLSRFLRTGPASQSHDTETFRTVERTFPGIGFRPYAPAHLKAERSGNFVHLNWVRRTRFGGDGWDREPPLSEESERYLVTVEAQGETVRHEIKEPFITLTAPTPVKATIAQVSAQFGPGFSASITA